MFGYTRLMVAAFGLGAGWAALDRAIPYSTKRIQAGAPLSEKQGYTHKLIVPHVARLEAGRAYIEETAARIDAGEGSLNTEGAIAKYMATEAGNAAAEASIQALGGYGYTHEYMVEKISRDVRITTIYEGTSEIMEMTISRDRWQLHLKTRGQHYHEQARWSEALHARHPAVGANIAALALHALAGVMEKARVAHLTRHQHILLRLGELIAYAECAGSLARRAALAAEGKLHEKASRRFDATALATLSRIFAREAALKVAEEGLRWIIAAGGVSDAEMPAFELSLGLAGHAPRTGWSDCRTWIPSPTCFTVAPLQERNRSRLKFCGKPGRASVAYREARCLSPRRSIIMENTAYRAIAIVGAGAVLPDAPNVAAFWENVKNGRYSISEVTPERWDPALYYDPDHTAPDKTYSKIGGWVREHTWDPMKWRLPIPPRVADAMDEPQKWGIACTREALEDYGYPKRPLNSDRTAVILGNAMGGEKTLLHDRCACYFPEYARELAESASFAALPAAVRRDITRELHDRME